MLTKYTTNERKKEQSAKIIFVIIMCDVIIVAVVAVLIFDNLAYRNIHTHTDKVNIVSLGVYVCVSKATSFVSLIFLAQSQTQLGTRISNNNNRQSNMLLSAN